MSLTHVVPMTGLEPVRFLGRGILSPLRLPIPPHRHIKFFWGTTTKIYRTVAKRKSNNKIDVKVLPNHNA